jgi:hypothetical protein
MHEKCGTLGPLLRIKELPIQRPWFLAMRDFSRWRNNKERSSSPILQPDELLFSLLSSLPHLVRSACSSPPVVCC